MLLSVCQSVYKGVVERLSVSVLNPKSHVYVTSYEYSHVHMQEWEDINATLHMKINMGLYSKT